MLLLSSSIKCDTHIRSLKERLDLVHMTLQTAANSRVCASAFSLYKMAYMLNFKVGVYWGGMRVYAALTRR